MLHIFSRVYLSLYIVFGEMPVYVFDHFKIRLFIFFFTFCLFYTLDTSPLLDMCFANIFFYSVPCVLIFLTGSVIEQKFLILVNSTLCVFPFMDHAFGIKSEKCLCSPGS